MEAPNLNHLIDTLIARSQSEQSGCIPGIVLAVDLAKSMCTVRPAINTLYKDETSEEREMVMGVPIIYSSGRTSAITFPIEVGDTVLCIPMESNIDSFKASLGEPTTPLDFRKNSEMDYVGRLQELSATRLLN